MASRFLFLALVWMLTGVSSLQALTITGVKVFGDSLSDIGNSNNTVLNIPGQYSAAYYQGRWSNGPVWVENFNNALGFAPLTRNPGNTATGSDFAYGGSTTGTQTDISSGILHNLQTQVSQYLNNSAGAGPNGSIGTDLFVLWSGGNDIINRVQGTTAGDPLAGPGNISLAITNLYNAGARQFMIPNLPALGFKPSFLGTAAEAPANAYVNSFNSLLSADLDQLETDHSDIQILRLDVFGLVNSILASPGDYNFTNVTQGALNVSAPDPQNYLFWDDTHPTAAGHTLISNQAIALVPEPQTVGLVMLGMALVVVAGVRRKRAGV